MDFAKRLGFKLRPMTPKAAVKLVEFPPKAHALIIKLARRERCSPAALLALCITQRKAARK